LRFEIETEKYQEAYARLKYAIQEGNGFALLTGEEGTGKSFLISRIMPELPKNYKIIRVSGTQLSAIVLLRSLCRSFELKVSGTKDELIIQLNQYLNRQETNEKAVVFIEEAHLLKPGFLEEIRLLSNLETASDKLIQIILAGQPSFHQILALPQLRQLKQRISIEAVLDRLNFMAMKHYIHQRIKIAGCSDVNLFTEQAYDDLYKITNGIPAKINYYADRALFFGYLQQQSPISHLIIQQINLLEQHENEKKNLPENILSTVSSPALDVFNVISPVKRARIRWITGIFILIFSMIFIYELIYNRKFTYITEPQAVSLNQGVLIDSSFRKDDDWYRKKMNLKKEPAYLSFSDGVRQLAEFSQSGKSMALIKRIVNKKDTLYQIIVFPNDKIKDKISPVNHEKRISRK